MKHRRAYFSKIIISVVFILFTFLFLDQTQAGTVRKALDRDTEIILEDCKDIFFSVQPRDGEGYVDLATAFTDSGDNWTQIREINKDVTLLKGKRYLIPFGILSDKYQLLAVKTLFLRDGFAQDHWKHYVSGYSSEEAETLWRISEWFTGKGSNYKEIAAHNNMKDYSIRRGEEIRIPQNLLLSAFMVDPEKEQLAGCEELLFASDDVGEYAEYRLKKGEALYSAVVVRFTGLLGAEDVILTANSIAERSGIKDVTDISVGYPVKIPKELLLPEYLPLSDPRRQEFENIRERAEGYKLKDGTENLKGVYVILDPGHGGSDPGAIKNEVWEDDYVYDISCRIKQILERETSAIVLMTLKDKSSGYTVFDKESLEMDKDELIQVTPPFFVMKGQTGIGVNLRWYFANFHYNILLNKGIEKDRIVFTSIHADSLHPSVKGVMIYVPGAHYAHSKFGKSGDAYLKYKEVKTKQYFSISKKELLESEGLSYNLANFMMREVKKSGISIHPYQPVRNHVVRRKSAWLPAVLSYNIVPTKLLIEVCNLNNNHDAGMMKTPGFREKFARAYVNALLNYYK